MRSTCRLEEAVKAAQPKTVMCSYNKINGVYASENKMLLTDILRDQWALRVRRQ